MKHDPLCSGGEVRGDQVMDCDCAGLIHQPIPDGAETEPRPISPLNDRMLYASISRAVFALDISHRAEWRVLMKALRARLGLPEVGSAPEPTSAEKLAAVNRRQAPLTTMEQVIDAFLIHCDSRPICDYCDVKFDTGQHHPDCLVSRAIALRADTGSSDTAAEPASAEKKK